MVHVCLYVKDLEAKAAAAEMGVVIEDGDEESSRYYCDDDGEGKFVFSTMGIQMRGGTTSS